MHAIRLRRPWSKRVVDGDAPDASDGGRVDVPDDMADVGAGCVEYERRFNRPTGIDVETRVWLDVGGWSGRLCEVRLNDEPLELGRPPFRVDVTDKIAAHNRLFVSLERSGNEPPRLSGEIRLLIEERPDTTAGR